MAPTSASAVERPLPRLAKLLIMIGAAAAILVFYLFAGAMVLLLGLLLAAEAVLVLPAARVGMAAFFLSLMRRHAPLIALVVQSFLLRKGDEFRITLSRAEAPRLFALIEKLATRLQVAPPHDVWIEMNLGAWVRLRGYRAGAGRTTLGLGYDLLAALSEAEVEAVIAHEMAHAKLVQRGLKRWLNGGLARLASLSGKLSELVDAYRRANIDFMLATLMLRVADAQSRQAARLIARYSRQDEFEADHGAAEVCGAAALRSSLLRLESVAEKVGRLPWRERVAQLQIGGSFSAWLVEELDTPPADLAAVARDAYSTHPALPDRLAALPEDGVAPPEGGRGVALLAEPDRVAGRLMAEIQAVLARQEQADTKELARWARRSRRSVRMRPQQWPAVLLCVVGLLLVIWAYARQSGSMAVGGLVALAAVYPCIRFADYRDRRVLAVPAYAAMKQAWDAGPPADLTQREKRLEAELNAEVARVAGPTRRDELIDRAFTALGTCDYLPALVASRLALHQDPTNPEALAAYAVASAGLGLSHYAQDVLGRLQKYTAMRTPTSAWAAAWSLVILGDWARAEALLWEVSESQPNSATLLALLSIAQRRRGKMQSAVMNAARAFALMPNDTAHAKLLAQTFVDAGRLRDAAERLRPLETAAARDPELALLFVRSNLMQRQIAEAHRWGEPLRGCVGGEHWLIPLADAFATARQDEAAAAYYEAALVSHHYPEAHLGLARLATTRRDIERARRHLASALNLRAIVGPRGRSTIELFHAILAQHLALEEPREDCRAWIATVRGNAAPACVREHSFMVFAPDFGTAVSHLGRMLRAMEPAAPPFPSGTFTWEVAPRDQQPARPVRPGVQFVL